MFGFEAGNSGNREAYRLGASALLLATAVILAALGFEHIGGLKPCPLCLEQRWAYYIGIPAIFAALAVLSTGRAKLSGLLLLAISLLFLYNSGLGVYHAGAEWKLWPGPDTCGGALQPLSTGKGGILGSLGKSAPVVRCDEAAWRFLGISMAGWNALISLALSLSLLKAAFSAASASPTNK